MDGHVWVLAPLRRQAALALHGRLADRVVAGRASTASTSSAPGTGRSRRSTCARTGCAGACTTAARSPRPRRVAGATLYIGDYCGRLLALNARTGRAALVAQRQRPRLRHACRRRRPRLRAELDRRLADGVLDARPLPLAARHRLVRLLVARRVATAASSSAPTTASSTRCARRTARRSGRAAPAARSPARRSSSTASPTPARSRTASSASTRASGRVVLDFPHGEYVPGLGRRAAPAPARLLAALRGAGAMRAAPDRALPRSCSPLLGAGARVLPPRAARRRATSRARRRSSSCPTAAPPPPPKEPGVAWPTYGHDRERQRFANGVSLAPPFRARLDVPRAERSSSSRPRSPTGGSSSPTTPASLFAIGAKNGKRAWKYVSHRCVAASPGGRPSRRLRDVPERAAVQPRAERAADRRAGRVRRRLRARCSGGGRSARRSRRRSSPAARSSSATGAAASMPSASAPASSAGRRSCRRPGEGRRRGLRRARVYVGDYSGHVYALNAAHRQDRLAGEGAAALRPRRATSTRRRRSPTGASTSARPTGRCTRSARPPASCAGRSRPAATSTRRPRSGATASSPAPTRTASSASTRRPATILWQFKANGPISGSPTVVAGRVYFATLEGTTYALDAKTGRQALDVPGRQVLAGRRRREPALPRRQRTRIYGLDQRRSSAS